MNSNPNYTVNPNPNEIVNPNPNDNVNSNKILLPYDIIYNIYFYIKDYETALQFWTLSRSFYKNFMSKYNQSYKHKYNLVYTGLFRFLSMLPKESERIDYHLQFYEYVSTMCMLHEDKQTLRRDIRCIYYFYKNFLINFFVIRPSDFPVAYDITMLIMMSGETFINSILNVDICKNRIRITARDTINSYTRILVNSRITHLLDTIPSNEIDQTDETVPSPPPSPPRSPNTNE